MGRRAVLKTSGVVTTASLVVVNARRASAIGKLDAETTPQRFMDTVRTWHLLDRWRVDDVDNLKLQQGQPGWQVDATYCEPHIGALPGWPTIVCNDKFGQ